MAMLNVDRNSLLADSQSSWLLRLRVGGRQALSLHPSNDAGMLAMMTAPHYYYYYITHTHKKTTDRDDAAERAFCTPSLSHRLLHLCRCLGSCSSLSSCSSSARAWHLAASAGVLSSAFTIIITIIITINTSLGRLS